MVFYLAMSFSPEFPYNDLPDLPPPCEIETKAVLRKVAPARAALAALAEKSFAITKSGNYYEFGHITRGKRQLRN